MVLTQKVTEIRPTEVSLHISWTAEYLQYPVVPFVLKTVRIAALTTGPREALWWG